ncbi:hypothetical protein WR25_17996 [Diploscapter pachys]|uniref:Uncharacterized protein n=1 Tax=Diploscapter pachys TaxID=2018661 RepID=A0A2A2JFW2_9BILA|nr:hypothetical protein WR25_17996 [Diploscapter pachys]
MIDVSSQFIKIQNFKPLAEAASTIPSMSLVPSPVNEMVHRVPCQQVSTPRNSGIISFQTSGSTYPFEFGLYYDEAGVLRWLDGGSGDVLVLGRDTRITCCQNGSISVFSMANSPGNENNGVEVVLGLTWNIMLL